MSQQGGGILWLPVCVQHPPVHRTAPPAMILATTSTTLQVRNPGLAEIRQMDARCPCNGLRIGWMALRALSSETWCAGKAAAGCLSEWAHGCPNSPLTHGTHASVLLWSKEAAVCLFGPRPALGSVQCIFMESGDVCIYLCADAYISATIHRNLGMCSHRAERRTRKLGAHQGLAFILCCSVLMDFLGHGFVPFSNS